MYNQMAPRPDGHGVTESSPKSPSHRTDLVHQRGKTAAGTDAELLKPSRLSQDNALKIVTGLDALPMLGRCGHLDSAGRRYDHEQARRNRRGGQRCSIKEALNDSIQELPGRHIPVPQGNSELIRVSLRIGWKDGLSPLRNVASPSRKTSWSG